ncbi:MAG: hypothetical protein WBV94_33120 [Blastocatellia bacterium]
MPLIYCNTRLDVARRVEGGARAGAFQAGCDVSGLRRHDIAVALLADFNVNGDSWCVLLS